MSDALQVWYCTRCETIVAPEPIREDGARCKCTESPSPWAPALVCTACDGRGKMRHQIFDCARCRYCSGKGIIPIPLSEVSAVR